MTLQLTSPAFRSGDRMPTRHTLDGENLSPPLEWSGAPAGTKSFVLVVEDPDAPSGLFTHWGLQGIPPGETSLPEGFGATSHNTAVNHFGNARYDGPSPPRGHGVHHYHFRLAALDVDRLALPARAKVGEVWKAAKGHILAEAELVGLYER